MFSVVYELEADISRPAELKERDNQLTKPAGRHPASYYSTENRKKCAIPVGVEKERLAI
jgi:hypothetical protein